jgi:hypothetical protein
MGKPIFGARGPNWDGECTEATTGNPHGAADFVALQRWVDIPTDYDIKLSL